MSGIKFRQHVVALIGFAALWICGCAQAAQVRAWLDRNAMQLGETVTLNVEVSDDTSAAQPDFNVLQSDFNLLGTQSSTAMNIINGQASSKLLWAVGLEPKHAGTIVIPAFNVAGAQTQPINLTVQPASGNGGKAGDDVFLQVAVEPHSPYVQQQAHATVKLFYAIDLIDAAPFDPQGDGLEVHKLGQDASYFAEIGGRRYKVLERHYALSAQKSGVLALAPLSFRGHAISPNDPNSFFSRGRVVSVQAPATTLEVRARPQASGTDAWLPAQSLDLSADGIDATTEARVGEPITLTLRVKAQGLGFEQLPELKLPKIDGADVYPDKETTLNRDDGTWQYGERERKFAIVPNRAGKLTLPAISLAWWDTARDKAAIANLPAQTLNVAPAVAGAGADAHGATPQKDTSTQISASADGVAGTASPGASSDDTTALRGWRALALLALGLWLATLAAWIYSRRRASAHAPAHVVTSPNAADDVTLRAARKAFADACARNDASACARALVAWARAQGSAARTPGELAARLTDPAQREAVQALEQTLYGAASEAAPVGIGARLSSAFGGGLSLAQNTQRAPAQSALPPLYPFEVRKDGTTGR